VSRARFALPLLLAAVVAAIALFRSEPTAISGGAPAIRPESGPAAPSGVPSTAGRRDLARDEANGGHTLARHVGLSDAELRERLAEERGISAASTFTDRETAERVVAAALTRESARIERWLSRGGGNLALDYRGARGEIVGRALARGERVPRPSGDARIVLRRHGGSFAVLTAYPLEPR
jgi:hypothetical protein